MRVTKKLAVILASAVVLGGGAIAAATATAAFPPPGGHTSALVAGPNNVSSACATGVWQGYCGSQQNVSDDLVFSYRNDSDWVQVGYEGTNQVFFNYAPGGLPTNTCITDSSSTSGTDLTVTPCTGASSQLFTAAQGTNGGYTWTNVGTQLNIQDNGSGKPLTANSPDGSANQEWNFVS